jgi:hypothetical protein
MKSIIFLISTILVLLACNKEKINPAEPMSDYLKTSLSISTIALTDSTKGILWMNNLSSSKFDYPVYVCIHLFDTVNKLDYISYH